MLLPFLLLVVVCFGSTHTYSLIITFEAKDEREKETRGAGEVVRILGEIEKRLFEVVKAG